MSRFNYEELATLHTIAKILTQSGDCASSSRRS